MRPIPALLLVLLLVMAAGCGGGGGGDDAGVDAAADEDAPAEAAGDGAAGDGGAEDGPTADDKEVADLTLPAGTAPEDPDGGTAEAGQPDPEPAGLPTDEVPGGRFVEITAITADGDAYAVEFTAHNYTPLIGTGPEDFHIHFFWDSVEPENAGTNSPSPGEWFVYDGPSPFTGYTAPERPADATAMCALVADAAHAVEVGSGTCVELP